MSKTVEVKEGQTPVGIMAESAWQHLIDQIEKYQQKAVAARIEIADGDENAQMPIEPSSIIVAKATISGNVITVAVAIGEDAFNALEAISIL